MPTARPSVIHLKVLRHDPLQDMLSCHLPSRRMRVGARFGAVTHSDYTSGEGGDTPERFTMGISDRLKSSGFQPLDLFRLGLTERR